MLKKELETYCPKNRMEWRGWLEKNHHSKHAIWLVYYKTATKIPSLSWSEAVDEALCFGWIDSTKKTIDDKRYMQYFSKRKPKSVWSKINKEKVDLLIQNKQMTKSGFESIAIAKQNGYWSFMDDAENLIIPNDLKKALAAHQNSFEHFLSLSKSKQKELLGWIVLAKRPETKQKRIRKIIEYVNQGI
ncbi:YdeI/OmpD-associated family protein [Polaribacter dokdonensis]|uniref:Uncharacterized conserved protein YdeI, YjbR/CyaY-like superfamily, DUF1801 family n=1 Tax=Polaribacter dokdonensis DSW-5 TaxID=1300348 RepID=A0A0M9CII5_9FLAO|nr:YdeI/OmpD-associated family protein [Polaribacter dokdonensis]KOY53136.1 hypothetical protein I602_2696 [Polaribacter dokdonensis DSW-5]SEE57596.1 Uncharacterized conserved protein YdeI, YjbR/CyaY-like superfamily, DUF1801 family [Polaribacter dokdonensis DSW-5]